jgi:hypothetical protein
MARSRSGLSLVELMAAVFLGSLVGGIITTTLVRQQRFYRGAEELHYVREGTRDAAEVLSTDIRGLSVDDTVRLRTDSAIEFFANIGSSVACQIAGNEIGLPGAHSSGSSLSAFLVTPDTGDLALLYRAGDSGQAVWEQHRILSFSSRSLSASCPASSGFSEQAEMDAAASGFVVALAPPVPTEVIPGSPIRFVRRGRYSLYRASDGAWYLGYRRCNAVGVSQCGAIQPVSGAYRAYSRDTLASGLVFEYFDLNGQRLTQDASPMTLARVDVTARSEGAHPIWSGERLRRIADSATISIAIRNGTR